MKAQEIYDALTDKGYKVFFSRITLEDKLGQEYEPYIFAALNSAKVMLVIGTRPEYVNAVWVKNEWSRYLKIMAKEKGKILIPCYLNMNPYDLPEEFKNLQGQDMSKIGFIQDLVRGIGKIIPRQSAQPAPQNAPAQQGVVASFSSLMKRIDIFLEQGDYDNAAKTCDKILDADPENAEAYIKKLLIERKVSSLEELAKSDADFLENSNFKMALRFGGERVEQQVFGSNPAAAFSYYTKNSDYEKFMEYAGKYTDSLPGKAIMNALKKFRGEHGDMLEALIDLGMDPDMTFEWGVNVCQKGTIAHYVYNDDNIYDKLSYLKALIERGANVNKMLFTHNDDPEEYEDGESECTLLALAAGECSFSSKVKKQ